MSGLIPLDMELEDLAAKYPYAIRLFSRRNIICIKCGTPLWITVEEAIRRAGHENVEEILEEVNKELAKELHS